MFLGGLLTCCLHLNPDVNLKHFGLTLGEGKAGGRVGDGYVPVHNN